MKYIFILLTSMAAFSACKKKTADPAPVNSTPQDSPMQSGVGSNANNLNGCMVVNIQKAPGSPMVLTSTLSVFNTSGKPAGFYYKPEGGAITDGMNAGTLQCNSDTVDFMLSGNGGFYYEFSVGQCNNTPVWKVGGNGSFSAFETTVTRGFPVSANLNFFPASASTSSNLTVQLNGVYSNADSLYISIDDGNNKYSSKRLAGNATSATFTPTDMSGFASGNGTMYVIAYNYSNQTIGGKHYIFVLQQSSFASVAFN
jgi:hypothetical protein